MADKQIVFITHSAENQITAIHDYIFEASNPLNGARYTDRLISFIYSLSVFPQLHSLCRVRAFSRYKWRCAVFENNIVIAYKIVEEKIIVMRIIHAKRLK